MTLTEEVLAPERQEHGIPVLKTERLSLRAPRHGDAKAMTLLVNDRRIAANTARIPHPYGIDDAKQFLAAANKRDGKLCWAITLDGALRMNRVAAAGLTHSFSTGTPHDR